MVQRETDVEVWENDSRLMRLSWFFSSGLVALRSCFVLLSAYYSIAFFVLACELTPGIARFNFNVRTIPGFLKLLHPWAQSHLPMSLLVMQKAFMTKLL